MENILKSWEAQDQTLYIPNLPTETQGDQVFPGIPVDLGVLDSINELP